MADDCFEIAITIKNEEQTLRCKFLTYAVGVEISREDPVLKDFIDSALKSFPGLADDVTLRITMKI